MSQNSHKYGGLGLGTTGTSYIFLGCILALVAYLTITKRDQTPEDRVAEELHAQSVVPPNPYRVGVDPLTPLSAEERPS